MAIYKKKHLLKKLFAKFLQLDRIFQKCVARSSLKKERHFEELFVGCSSTMGATLSRNRIARQSSKASSKKHRQNDIRIFICLLNKYSCAVCVQTKLALALAQVTPARTNRRSHILTLTLLILLFYCVFVYVFRRNIDLAPIFFRM